MKSCIVCNRESCATVTEVYSQRKGGIRYTTDHRLECAHRTAATGSRFDQAELTAASNAHVEAVSGWGQRRDAGEWAALRIGERTKPKFDAGLSRVVKRGKSQIGSQQSALASRNGYDKRCKCRSDHNQNQRRNDR